MPLWPHGDRDRDPLVLLERRIEAGALVDDLIDLVQIPSVTGSPAERDAVAWLADRLAADRRRRRPLDVRPAFADSDSRIPGLGG